jgi:hypothetical protein
MEDSRAWRHSVSLALVEFVLIAAIYLAAPRFSEQGTLSPCGRMDFTARGACAGAISDSAIPGRSDACARSGIE